MPWMIHSIPRFIGSAEFARGFSRVFDRPIAAGDAAARLARLRRLAWLLDAALKLPGTRFRFGLSGLAGLPPGLGDAITTSLSLYIVWEARRLGLPRAVLIRMLANVAVEAGAGFVPVLGNLFDAGYKANLRNIALIEAALRGR